MLQNIRKNLQGTIAKVIVAIIVVPFALFGIESLLSGGGVQSVAEVNGQSISAAELQRQVNQQKRRLLMTMGDNIDPSMLDDQFLSGPALEYMIQKKVMMQAAEDYGLAVSDARVGSLIGDMDVFKQDGVFDPNLYRRVVSDQGYSPTGFQQALREDLILSQLRSGIAGSTFATGKDVAQLATIQREQRDIRYLVLPLERFRDDADISEAQVESWYQENQSDYMTEESVRLAYLELTADDFREPVAEEEIRELFEIEKDSFAQAEERRVSHILLARSEDESSEDFEQRIADVQARTRADGADFASLAGELSDDVGSASLGGDLGFTAGDVFPEAMEESIASLAEGEVSGPVETDAGTHFIKVTEIRGGSTQSFEEVRDQLESRLQEEQSTRELVKTVENLRDLAFNAEDLAGPAAELGLELEIAERVTRNQSEGLFANPRLIAAAFSSDVLSNGYNSEVLEVDNEHFVVLRVLEHRLPEPVPLDEVREAIITQLRDQKARQAIAERANELLEDLRGGATIEAVALENDFEWQVELATTRNNPAVPAEMLRRAFRLPAPEQGTSTFEYVQNSEGDVTVFELVRVAPGDSEQLAEAQLRGLERQLVNEEGQRIDEYYQQTLVSNADISRSQ